MTDHHPHTTKPAGPPPTPRQQRYLRQLALPRRVPLVPPRSSRDASRLIDQLKRRAPDAPADRRRELLALQDDLAGDRGEAARVRADEVSGYGSNCTWKGGRP